MSSGNNLARSSLLSNRQSESHINILFDLVYITLFPLDNTAISRRFVLDPDHVSILVGRASKTANKGLKPDATNTWFDSPIMSREHASFVMDSCAKVSRYAPFLLLLNPTDQGFVDSFSS